MSALLKYYSLPVDRLIIVHDELDIPFDTVRLKQGGGHGGHNGVRDVSKATDAGDFTRVRVGIGRPPGRQDAADFVLKDFSGTEKRRRCRTCCRMPRTRSRRSSSTGSWPRSSGSTRPPERRGRPGASDQAAQELLGREALGAGALHEAVVLLGRELERERCQPRAPRRARTAPARRCSASSAARARRRRRLAAAASSSSASTRRRAAASGEVRRRPVQPGPAGSRPPPRYASATARARVSAASFSSWPTWPRTHSNR